MLAALADSAHAGAAMQSQSEPLDVACIVDEAALCKVTALKPGPRAAEGGTTADGVVVAPLDFVLLGVPAVFGCMLLAWAIRVFLGRTGGNSGLLYAWRVA